jgi:hypothetical protein
MVVDKVCCILIATTLDIALFASKTFIFHHLFNEDGKGPMELFKGENLNQTWLKFAHLCSPSIHNLDCFIEALS